MSVIINTEARGLCSVCGHEVTVMRNGHPRPHMQRRVRMSKSGKPLVYASKTACDGDRHPAEPVDATVDNAPMPVGPMNAERWPSARELVAERFDLPKSASATASDQKH